MIFILITFFAAFLIEALGTYVSVIGLSTLFGANPIIIALAVALDMGKLVVVTLLYTYWEKLNRMMKTYALVAATITMIITSAGAAGYLSGEFQKAILGTQEVGLKVEVLKTEQAKLETRKKQIDDSIAQIPDRYTANQKIRLMAQFKAEQKQVTDRLNEISKQLPDVQIQQISVEAKAGPILYVAKAFDISVERAVKWVILMIIFVFDPLAVFLIIAGNFLLHVRRTHKDVGVTDADLFADDYPKNPGPLKLAEKQGPFNDDLADNWPTGSEPNVETKTAMTEARAMQKAPIIEPTSYPPAPPARAEEVVQSPVSFRDPDAEREIITLSSLRDVKPDPSTITDAAATPPKKEEWEVGIGTGVYKTGAPK